MNQKLISAVEWLWKTNDRDLWVSPPVLTSLNDTDPTAPRLSCTESHSMFRFLQQKQLIFPVPVENGHIGYIIDKLKQDEWTSTIKELKRPQWHKTIIWLVALFSKPTVFMMGAIASPIIADIYTNRISPYFAKPAIPDGPNQVISQLGTQDGQDGDRPHVK